jgi:hypothetical protein
MSNQSKYCEIAYTHCLPGGHLECLANVVCETPGTVEGWIATLPEFRDAVECGRTAADAKIEDALFRVLAGYEETVERVVMRDGEPTIDRHVKRHPPKRPQLLEGRDR